MEAAIAQAPWDIAVVLSGHARGADRLGEDWARARKVPLEVYPARWDEEGKVAGFRRNQRMADKADALIALWDGESRGTLDMIRRAKGRGLYIHVVNTKEKA